jgi:threonine aldolase
VDALLERDLWLTAAQHANAMASRLGTALAGLAGVRLAYPVQSNGVFTEVSRSLANRLLQEFGIQEWSQTADGARSVVRWMTAFDTTAEEVASVVAEVRRAAGQAAATAEPWQR